MNIRLIAVEAGDALKYDTSVNEIERIGSAVLPFRRDDFRLDSITSVRAKRIYDWLMSLGNPTAHEPALHWPITEQDAVDILSFISFLFRQLERAVKHP